MGKTFKDIKKHGKHTFEGPKVKERKHFAPATKTEKPKKGKGSYDRKNAFDEDEQYAKDEKSENKKKHLDDMRKNSKGVSFKPTKKTDKPKKGANAFEQDEEGKVCWKGYEKKGTKKKGGKTVNNCVKESASINKFIEAIMSENPAEAHKHLKDTINQKIQKRIADEIDNPLF